MIRVPPQHDFTESVLGPDLKNGIGVPRAPPEILPRTDRSGRNRKAIEEPGAPIPMGYAVLNHQREAGDRLIAAGVAGPSEGFHVGWLRTIPASPPAVLRVKSYLAASKTPSPRSPTINERSRGSRASMKRTPAERAAGGHIKNDFSNSVDFRAGRLARDRSNGTRSIFETPDRDILGRFTRSQKAGG